MDQPLLILARSAYARWLAAWLVAAGALNCSASEPLLHGAIDWSRPLGRHVSPLAFGLNVYHGFNPHIAGTPGNATYKSNVHRMRPGIIRYHHAAMLGDSAKNPNGWVTYAPDGTPSWDREKIKRALTGSYSHGPVVMMNIPGWPDIWNQSSAQPKLRAESREDFARFCAELVRIVNVEQQRAVRYWEVTNEKDETYGAGCAELGRIVVQCAKAMKQVDPGIRVGGASFARADLLDRVDAFLSTAAAEIDFVSFHTSATASRTTPNSTIFDHAANLGGYTRSIRASARRHTARPLEMFHDEFNINWNPPDVRMNNITGAVFDTLALISMINAGTTGGMAWNEADGWFGKLDFKWRPRPSAWLYEMLNTDGFGEIVFTESSDESKLVLLGLSSSGARKLILVNRAETQLAVRLRLNGLDVAAAPDAPPFLEKQVTANGFRTGSVSYDTLSSSYVLPANTITLLTWQPAAAGSAVPVLPPTPSN